MDWEREFAEQLRAISPNSIDSVVAPCPAVTLCGVIMEARPIRRSGSGKRDYMGSFTIMDPTGSIKMNLFHPIHSELPQVESVAVGDVLLIKRLGLQKFNNANQGISQGTAIHVTVRNGERVESLRQSWIDESDRRVIKLIQRWWAARVEKATTVPKIQPTFGRPLIEVHALTDSIKYFDIVLQVIIKDEQARMSRMMVYLTDYTMNPLPPMSFLDTRMADMVDVNLVIQGSFWDNQATLINTFRNGEIVKIRNAVRSISPNNELEFNLRGSNDARPQIHRLLDDDPEARPLRRRRDAFERNRQEQISMSQSASQMSQRIMPYSQPPQPPQPPPPQNVYQQQQQFHQAGSGSTSTVNTLSAPYSPTPAFTPSSWQAAPQQILVDDVMDIDDIATEVTDNYSYKSIEELFNAEVGTRCFTKACIIDSKPRKFEDWINKICPTCHETASIDHLSCPNCDTPTELEMILKFALKIQDTANHKMLLSCFGQEAVKLFPGIDLNNVGAAVEIIKEFIEQACPIIPEKQTFLDFGVESYDINGGRCYQVVNTKFIKLA